MSNKELEEFIRTISFGDDPGMVGSGYVKIVDPFNKYSSLRCFFLNESGKIWAIISHTILNGSSNL